MFSRLSEAMGCPRSKEYPSTDSSVPEGDHWLSQSTRDSALFVIPTPNLQEILRIMGVSRCCSTGQFYFDQLPSNPCTEQANPWAVAHSARQRCKLVDSLLIQAEDRRTRLVKELRNLAMSFNENLMTSELATFSELLVPLLTEKPKLLDTMNDNVLSTTVADDVLILFGSPATIFQLLLSVPSLRCLMTDLILELVASSSPHSIRLLEQFKQPVGLTTMFSGKKAFAETATRLLELFQVVTDPAIQASILVILPDLASSPCAANCALTDEDRSILIMKLIDLLGSIPTGTVEAVQKQTDPLACLVECLTSFSVDRELALRLPDTLFELLDRCYSPEAYYAYLPLITRSLLVHGPSVPRQSVELSKWIRRLRTYFIFPKTPIKTSGANIESTLIDLLRVAFQFNRQLMVDWMHAVDTSEVRHCEATESDLQAFHEQAAQDFLILCIMHSVADIHLTGTASVTSGSRNTALMLAESGSSGQTTRLQSETATLVRRLVSSGRLFPSRIRTQTIDSFLTSHSSLLSEPRHRLFPTLLYFLDQLISSPCTSPLNLSTTLDCSSSIRAVGSALYTSLFCAPTCLEVQRQDIVIHLVRHSLTALPDPEKTSRIRRGTNKQKVISRTGLQALFRLARLQPTDLAGFDTILFGMMDRLMRVVSAWAAASDSCPGTCQLDQAYSSLMEVTRRIVLVLAWIGFCNREQKSIQEKLLSIMRKQLSSSCLMLKALGVLGAVVVLETICRRAPLHSADLDPPESMQVSTQYDDSIVLAGQLAHIEQERASTSTTSTSRTSNTSCLSLRGPGTGMADDSREIHVPIEDTEEDPDDLDEHSRTTRASDRGSVTPMHTPPSRLLLQLIGLVEHAIGSHTQLHALWLEEIAACFTRLAQNQIVGSQTSTASAKPPLRSHPSKSLFGIPSSVQTSRLINWMGARVMRDFQNDFVKDNVALDGHTCQLNLNDPTMCEVAVAIGPTWYQYQAILRERSCGTTTSPERKLPNPLFLPAQIKLIGITESVRLHGTLDAIDALLGCPLLLPIESQAVANSRPIFLHFSANTENEAVLLICVSNWCLEVVNVFAWSVPTIDSAAPFEDVATYSMPCATILSRLTHIAYLRQQLYGYLHELETRSGVRFESTDSVEGVHTLNTLCLPTVTYEPGKAFMTHVSLSTNGKQSEQCFTCGVHLDSQYAKGSVVARKATSLKSSKSKCASKGSEPRNAVSARTTKAKRRRSASNSTADVHGTAHDSGTSDVDMYEADRSCEEIDDHETEEEDSHNGTTETGEDKVGSADGKQSQLAEKGKSLSKMAASNLRRTAKAAILSTSLDQLTPCFRELDLAALTLGLSAWPWISEMTESGVHARPVTIDAERFQFWTLDWVTLAWLMDDLHRKLSHLADLNIFFSTGWYAFERLDNLEPHVRSVLLLNLVPHVQRVLKMAINCLTANQHLTDCDAICSSSSSSDSEDAAESSNTPVPVRINRSNGRDRGTTDPPSCTIRPSMTGDNGQLVSNVVCNALASLLLLCGGLRTPTAGTSKLLVDNSDTVTTTCAQFTLSCVSRLAETCRSTKSFTTRPHAICIRELIPSRKRYVDFLLDDGFVETSDTSDHEDSDTEHLSSNLRSILDWLFGMAPDGLPHIVAAFLHTRLVSYLTDLYTRNLVTQNAVQTSLTDPQWSPDLFVYTKSLLDQEWDTSARWKGLSYRESLQGILSLHLRSKPCLNGPNTVQRSESASALSPNLLLDFTQGQLLPTLRRYQGQDSCSPDRLNETSLRPEGYRTLTRSTAELFCREVMDTVLWFTRQLCVAGSNLSESDESLLLTSWNELVVILCLIVDLVRPSARSRNSRPTDETGIQLTPLAGLLPNVMRVGRLFLEGLLKGAMPLFSTVFRHRGLEVTTLLRNTQSLTRFLQRVCTHAKAYRNARLANQIPATRRCLETFVYRVKTMLSQNQCAEAFWLGTLKNRDLHGVELQDDSLLSRRTSASLVSGIASQTAPSGRSRRSAIGKDRGSSSQSLDYHNDDQDDGADPIVGNQSDSADTDASDDRTDSGSSRATASITARSGSTRLRRITSELERDGAQVDREDEIEDLVVDELEEDIEEDDEEPVDAADMETLADNEEELIDDEDDEVLIEPSDEEEY